MLTLGKRGWLERLLLSLSAAFYSLARCVGLVGLKLSGATGYWIGFEPVLHGILVFAVGINENSCFVAAEFIL